MQGGLSDGAVRLLRIAALAAGALLVATALLADVTGLSGGPGISRNQLLFAVAGAVLLAAGALGRRFASLYRGAALLLLNLIAVLLLLEMLSLVGLKLLSGGELSERAEKAGREGFIAGERSVTISSYVPWVLWRSEPSYEGDPATIDGEGRRVTPGSADSQDAVEVAVLGGSAIWGACVGDSGTVPAHLVGELSGRLGRPVRVRNLAQNAWTSTQEVIELMLELRSGRVPDAVVLCDGFNDVWAAYESGLAGVHHSLEPISARIEGRDAGFASVDPLALLLGGTNTGMLVSRAAATARGPEGASRMLCYRAMGLEAGPLAGEVAEVYLRNASLVEHLADAYGFEALFAWQPVLWLGEKELTEYELAVEAGGFEGYPAGGDPALHELLAAAYARYGESRPDTSRYLLLTGIFDDVREGVYVDHTGVHLSPEGNAMVAEALAERLEPLLSPPDPGSP